MELWAFDFEKGDAVAEDEFDDAIAKWLWFEDCWSVEYLRQSVPTCIHRFAAFIVADKVDIAEMISDVCGRARCIRLGCWAIACLALPITLADKVSMVPDP